MTQYTYADVEWALRSLAHEFPDRVAEKFHVGLSYFGCRYLDPDGCPSCVVGVALDRLGVPREEIAALDWEARYVGGSCPQSVGSSRNPLWGRFERKAKELLGIVQYHQDQGRMWANAIETAITEVT